MLIKSAAAVLPTSLVLCGVLASVLSAQVIDFETLPTGDATLDLQEISTQYDVYGVTFRLLDPVSGVPTGFPLIAKAGAPRTAFQGCLADDTPRPSLGLGSSFLTDGNEVAIEGDLLIEYATPVAQASGVILDIDCRTDGGSPCEQWTIRAFDGSGGLLQTVVIDGPPGPVNPECQYPAAGPGDSQAFGWIIDQGEPVIASILLKHTGNVPSVGLAFDNFSVASLPGPPVATSSSAADTVCAGEPIGLVATVAEGLPPYSYRWQMESTPGNWTDLDTASTQTVQPIVTTRYRVTITDARSEEHTSDPLEIVILEGDPLCEASLLVSSNTNDSVVRYSFRSGLPQVFVPSGSGGLNGPSKLTCGPDANLYVVSQNNDRVLRYDGATGEFIDMFVSGGSGGLNTPVGLDFGPDGNLYVASFSNHSILRYEGTTGAFVDAFIPINSGLNGPTGILFGPDGYLYICSFNGDKVLRFDGETGAFLDDFVSTGSGGLDAPRGLAFGPDGHLYVSEQYNDSIRRYDGTTGAFLDVFVPAGSGGLDRANDVTFGPTGTLYVPSFNNDLVMAYAGTTADWLGALSDPNGVLNGPAWVTVGCRPYATAVEDPGSLTPGTRVRFRVGYEQGVGGPVALRFELAQPASVDLSVYDVQGRFVVGLARGSFPTGPREFRWLGVDEHGARVARGLYFARLQVTDHGVQEAITLKVLVLD